MSPPDSTLEGTPPPAAAEDAPRYTWLQLDAALPEPSEAERALFDALLPAAALQARGAMIASERLLTDTQRWLGQLVDFERSVPEPGEVVLGYQPALARVLASHARRLRALTSSQRLTASELKARQKSAQKQLSRLVADARQQYATVLAPLLAASQVDANLHDRVSQLPGRPGQTALADQLRLLGSLLSTGLRGAQPLRARLAARKLGEQHVDALRTTRRRPRPPPRRNPGRHPPPTRPPRPRLTAPTGPSSRSWRSSWRCFPAVDARACPCCARSRPRTFFDTLRYRRAPTPPTP
jgi:hypothetical protein